VPVSASAAQPIPLAWRGVFEPLEAGTIATLVRHGACFETAIASALAIRAELAGHAFVDLQEFAGHIAIHTDPQSEPTRWPDLSSWLEAVRTCAFVASEDAGSVRPKLAHDCAIVLQETRIYTRRAWRTESDLAARILEHLGHVLDQI
jgi:hypothetical protein